jgi:hypothetical protein
MYMCAAVKINTKDMVVEVEDEMEDCQLEAVAQELPEFSPRFVAYRSVRFAQGHSRWRRQGRTEKGVWARERTTERESERRVDMGVALGLWLLSYCYNHGDGRVSFPLVFLHWCPTGAAAQACLV